MEIGMQNLNQDNDTLLHLAARLGIREAAEQLIGLQCDINATNNLNNTPLHEAILHQHWDIAHLLLDAGANVNIKNLLESYTPLHLAAIACPPEIITKMLIAGANINEQDRTEETPLHHAIRFNQENIAVLLVQHHASLFITNIVGETPLEVEASVNIKELVLITQLKIYLAQFETELQITPTHFSFSLFNRREELQEKIHTGQHLLYLLTEGKEGSINRPPDYETQIENDNDLETIYLFSILLFPEKFSNFPILQAG